MSPPVRSLRARLAEAASGRDVAAALLVIFGFSVVFRLVLVTVAHAPVVFSDELGYEKLAESIGRTGHFALFNEPGLSYSPLYPLLLSPIYALGVSAPTAYVLVKVANTILISLSVLPIYKIARFALPRQQSLIVAALSTITPLMFYASFSMSENLAYPLTLLAVWAMLAAIRNPGVRNDALLLGAIGLATASRVQLIILLPAALTAAVVAGVLGGERTGPSRLLSTLRRHLLLFGVVAAGLAIAGVGAIAGAGVYSVFGRYAEVGRHSMPSLSRFLNLFVRHVAELDLAVGVVPFIAAVVAGVAFARGGFPRRVAPFAAVALSTTVWLLLEVAYSAAMYDGAGGELVRIHERWLIYVMPFFLVAVFASIRIPDAVAPTALYVGVGAGASLLPMVIPFHTVINQASAVDTFGLQALAHTSHGDVAPIPLTGLAAVAGAALLSAAFVDVRRRTRTVVLLMLIPLVLISGQVLSRVSAGSIYTRSQLPAQMNWVDAVKPRGDVVLLTAREDATSALQTAYSNYSITRLYYICRQVAGPEFGEQQATIDSSGVLRDPSGPIRAAYAVTPLGLDLRGRVVARNPQGHQALVAVAGGRVSVWPGNRRAALDCKPERT